MRSVAAAILITLAVPDRALSNPLDAFGFGGRGLSMGGAMTAAVDDVSASYYNPAALAAITGLRIDLGYLYAQPSLSLGGHDLNVDSAHGFQGGLDLPGTLFGRSVAFALGLYLPDGRVTRLRALRQSQPRFELYDNRPQRLVITSSAAVEVVKSLYFGAGLTYLSNTEGRLDVQGTVHLTDASQTRLLSSIDVNLRAVRYPSFGLLWKPTPKLRLGLTERESFSLALDIDVFVHGQIVAGPPEQPPQVLVQNGEFLLRSVNHSLFSPRQVVFGLAYDFGDLLLTGDLGWLQWSGFPTSTARIDLSLSLSPLQFEIPLPDPPAAPHFVDIFVPRLGLEYSVYAGRQVGLLARAGYFLEPSPAPDQSGLTNMVDLDKHGFSAGLGFSFSELTSVFPKPVLLDLGALLIAMPDRDYEKSAPADLVGDYTASGSIVTVAASLGFPF